MRRPWGITVFAVVVALVWLGSPAAADAHLRSGTVAVDYQASISSTPSAAYVAQIFASDRALSLRVRPGHTVVLLGYLAEPVFRLDGAGLWINAASPTAMVLRLASSVRRSDVPGPIWKLRPGWRTVIWPDARTQSLPAGTQRGTWHVPLIVDGRHAVLQGRLRRFPAPELWPWALTLGVLVLAGMIPMLLGRRDLGDAMAIGAATVVAGAAIALMVALSLDAYASPGTWIEAVNTLACIAVGVGVLVAGPRGWRAAATGGVGALGLAVGLLQGAVFLHPIVLSILPSELMRILDVVAIGAGLAAAALSAWFYAEVPGTAAHGSSHHASEFMTAS